MCIRDRHQVEAAGRQVALQRGHVVGHAVAVSLPRLGGQVADVDDRGADVDERLSQIAQQEVGQDAGVEAARAEDDQVGLEERCLLYTSRCV